VLTPHISLKYFRRVEGSMYVLDKGHRDMRSGWLRELSKSFWIFPTSLTTCIFGIATDVLLPVCPKIGPSPGYPRQLLHARRTPQIFVRSTDCPHLYPPLT
jgi:hypothetical protein